MPLNRVTNLVNGNVVDAPELNSEFNNIINGLNSTNAVDILLRFNSPTNAGLVVNQQGAGPIASFLQNGANRVTVLNTGTVETISQFKSTVAIGTQPLDVVSTTKCNNLNADFIDGIDGASIAQLGIAKTAFSIDFYIPDSSLYPANSLSVPEWICPPGVSITVRQGQVTYNSGANTGGILFQFNRRLAGTSTFNSLGQINMNPSVGTPGVFGLITIDLVDTVLNAGDTLLITKELGASDHRGITFAFQGVQSFTT